eukprot:855257-Prymnesium_polylepis.1
MGFAQAGLLRGGSPLRAGAAVGLAVGPSIVAASMGRGDGDDSIDDDVLVMIESSRKIGACGAALSGFALAGIRCYYLLDVWYHDELAYPAVAYVGLLYGTLGCSLQSVFLCGLMPLVLPLPHAKLEDLHSASMQQSGFMVASL